MPLGHNRGTNSSTVKEPLEIVMEVSIDLDLDRF